MNKNPNTSGLRPFKGGKDHPRYPKKNPYKPKVVPQTGLTLAETFRSYTERAAHYLGHVLQNENEPTDMRLRAATVILARGWGDVPKTLITSPLDGSARAIELSEDDLLRIASSVETGIRNAQQSVIDVEPEPDASP